MKNQSVSKRIGNKIAQKTDEMRVQAHVQVHLAKKDGEVLLEEEVEPRMRELEVTLRRMAEDAARLVERKKRALKREARELKEELAEASSF